MVAWTTLGLNGSTVSLDTHMPEIPNQSAVRMMVPKLPGSESPSMASEKEAGGKGPGFSNGSSGMPMTARTPGGAFNVLIRDMSLDDTRSVSQASGAFESAVAYTACTNQPLASASSTPLSPSTTNLRSSRRVLRFLNARTARISFFVGMFCVPRLLARWAFCLALFALVWPKGSALGQGLPDAGTTAPLVWDVEWQLSQGEDSVSMNLSAWESMLRGGLAVRPPERFAGVPWRHLWAKLNGRWKRAVESGQQVPTGAASPFDGNLLEQSRALLESRMLRKGHLEGSVALDTSQTGQHVTLIVKLDPGPRQKCCSATVNADGSGLTQSQVQSLEGDWKAWEGQPLDLDALDRERERLAQELQQNGWFGLTADFFSIEIDTTESQSKRCVGLHLKVAPAQFDGLTVPHRKGRIDSLSFHWHPVQLEAMETREVDGIQWRVPVGRDLRGLSHNMRIENGGVFNPDKLSATRQSIRQLPLVQDLRVGISAMNRSKQAAFTPLHIHFDAYPSQRRVMRVNGAVTQRQNIGGEVALSLSDQDFRNRAEQLSLELGLGLESVQTYGLNLPEENLSNTLNSRILSAGFIYSTNRLIPFGAKTFSKSNKPKSRISLTIRDEDRLKFSRTFIQLGLVEEFVENPETGSTIELRPFEVAFTSSRLEQSFIEDLDSLQSDLLTSSFEPRALFSSGIRWRLKSARGKAHPFRWSFKLEFEGAGNLFHLLDKNEPAETTIKLPSAFAQAREVQVARYTRWMADLRAGWSPQGKNGIFGRCVIGVAASSIDNVSVPLEKQFYVGGPNSMRGWQALGLGPGGSDNANLRVRGDIRMEANLEFRRYVNDWIQCALFTDAGNVWMTRPDPELANVEFTPGTFLSQVAIACGAGVRLDFGYFLLRCDAGRPVRWPDGAQFTDSSWRIHPAISLPF